METNLTPNFIERVCPYFRGGSEVSDSDRDNEYAIQKIGSWAFNSIKWMWAVQSSGGIDFFVDQMYHEDTGKFDGYKWISAAHKPSAICFGSKKYWNIFNQRKGEKVVGGAELSTLGKYAIGEHTPLTIDPTNYQKEIKKLCTRNLFGLSMIKRHFSAIYDVADRYFQHTCFSKEAPVKVNLSEHIIQYISRANGVAIFGPPGSRAYEYINDVIFNKDGTPNLEWDQVPHSVEDVGQFVSDAILFSPKYFLNRILNEVYSLLKKSQLFDETLLPKTEYRRHIKILDDAAMKIRQASEKALSSTVIPEKHGSKDVKGMIELMLDSEKEYTDEQIEGMIRLLFVVGQRTTAVALEAAFKNLILYHEWQERLYAEISKKLAGKEIDYDSVNELEELDNFVWETLRLNPPVLIQTRDADEEIAFEVGKKTVTIPPGTTMAYIHYFAQRDPKYFKDPDLFNPDRFLGEKGGELKRELMTFGYYPHDCCGKWLALKGTIKAAIVNILLRAEVKAYDEQDVVDMEHVGGVILKHDRLLNAVFRLR